MSERRAPRPARASRGSRRRTRWIAIALAVGAVAGAVFVGASLLAPSPSPPSTGPPFLTVTASLAGKNGSVVDLDTGFLGVNLRADSVFSAASAADLNSTQVGMVRFPGGGLADRFDPLGDGDRGTIYNDSGATTVAETSLAEFVRWCRSTGCESILTLPAEIDNTSEVSAIVGYTENQLGFRPTFWEIGNEPALWEHFGIPWTAWNTSQVSTPTPAQFSGVVARYVAAIRAVDPTTGIIGLGGLGRGSSGQPEWISSVVSSNGPNLSAIAIHVYPAGAGFPSSDLAGWFGSLSGADALPARVPNVMGEIRSACSTCHLAVLADEFQTGTQLAPPNTLTGGYLATYVATEIVQAIGLPITSLDYYDFQSGTPGAWLNTQGSPSASLLLYQALATQFGPYASGERVASTGQGLSAAVGGSSPTALGDLMLVNSNASYGFRVNLTAEFPEAAGGSAWLFDGPSTAPSSLFLTPSLARNWTVPPASLVVFHQLGPVVALEPSRGEKGSAPTAEAGPVLSVGPPGTAALPAGTAHLAGAAGHGSMARAAEFRRTPAPLRDRAYRTPRSGTSA